ncbi:MAG: glycosyltransferase [Candidatus Electryonea clarkiae]|nr:glycosyltransferase [Candidatus Electryonea clarkiae]MDP8287725.1 glycosyltransferase [Candidatus Electryonea clarkiae]
MLMTIIFFTALTLVIYHILLFPLILIISNMLSRPESSPELSKNNLPTVALLISARNEEKNIGEKLENSLEIDYPADKLRIIVLANGCTDRTVEICKGYADKGIDVFEFGEIGKLQSQNNGVQMVDSEIVVFSDANTPYNKEAIRYLVSHFSDRSIGVVSGRHLYVNLDKATGATEGAYWNKIEYTMKKAESGTGGLIGANGAIYAVRRDLYIPPSSGDVMEDMYGPLLIAIKGHRTVYEPNAIASEHAEDTFAKEYRRKEMVVHRTANSIFFHYPWMLNPFKTGRIALLLWSHKILRWFTPILLGIVLLISIIRLISSNGSTRDWVVFTGATGFGFLATLGRGLGMEKPVPVLSHAWYLLMMFKAATFGLYKAVAKGGVSVWDHQR